MLIMKQSSYLMGLYLFGELETPYKQVVKLVATSLVVIDVNKFSLSQSISI